MQKFAWTAFSSDEPSVEMCKELLERVHKQLERPVMEQVEAVIEPTLESTNRPYAQRLRLNTRMQRSST